VNQPQFNQAGREKLKQGYPFARKDAEGASWPYRIDLKPFPGCGWLYPSWG
jgi:hypothetical protein